MPFVPVSPIIHLAATSVLCIGLAFGVLEIFKVNHPATRRFILASAILVPVGDFVLHFAYPRDCAIDKALFGHVACLTSSSLGNAGTMLLATSITAAMLRGFLIWVAQGRLMRASTALQEFGWTSGEDGHSRLASNGIRAKVQRALRSVEDASGISLQVRITRKQGICCTIGLRRPVIIISADLCCAFDNEELGAALSHEAAHIIRRDTWVGLVASLLKALTFFSPATYAGVRLYMNEREKAADDLASQITEDPLSLASAIVKVARLGSTSLVPSAAANVAESGVSGVRQRVERLLAEQQPSTRFWLPLAGAFTLGIALITFYIC